MRIHEKYSSAFFFFYFQPVFFARPMRLFYFTTSLDCEEFVNLDFNHQSEMKRVLSQHSLIFGRQKLCEGILHHSCVHNEVLL